MTRRLARIELVRLTRTRAKKECTTCAESVGEFRDELSKAEYHISGMCQQCQDEVFGDDDAV